MIDFTARFVNSLLKSLFYFEDVFWCRFTDHSEYTNSYGLSYGGFVYGFVWNKTKPQKTQTLLDFVNSKCVYVGQTTGEEYFDKKNACKSKLYSTCAKRIQNHYTPLMSGKSDEEKYQLFIEEYGFGEQILNGDQTLWLMIVPCPKPELRPEGFNKIAWALALEAMFIFIYGILNGITPLMNRQVKTKLKKDKSCSNEFGQTKNSLLGFMT